MVALATCPSTAAKARLRCGDLCSLNANILPQAVPDVTSRRPEPSESPGPLGQRAPLCTRPYGGCTLHARDGLFQVVKLYAEAKGSLDPGGGLAPCLDQHAQKQQPRTNPLSFSTAQASSLGLPEFERGTQGCGSRGRIFLDPVFSCPRSLCSLPPGPGAALLLMVRSMAESPGATRGMRRRWRTKLRSPRGEESGLGGKEAGHGFVEA